MQSMDLSQELQHLVQKGHIAVLQVKNNSGIFQKSFITDTLENASGGVHIALKGTAPNGTDIVAIGSGYSTNTTLFCVIPTFFLDSTIIDKHKQS